MIDFICKAMEFLMSIVGYAIMAGFLIILGTYIAYCKIENRPPPWEKEEAKAAKKAEKEKNKARRQFWGD